jgi:hypothetical protein
MDALSLDLFTEAIQDVERTQYRILARLQKARRAFEADRVYPHLEQLVGLYRTLQTVVEETERVRQSGGRVSGIDWDNRVLTYEWPEMGNDEVSVVEDLIRWALPHVQDAIEAGRSVYEHVDESLEMETVGIVPSYLEEGYFMVPARREGALHVLRYTLSIFRDDEEQYRMLKTAHCKSVPQSGVDVHPGSVKLGLLEERRDLPNPATYHFDTRLAVPYQETLLPIVKRRLMRHLSADPGV